MEITATTARGEIDSTRPFQSVREAVEVFGGVRRVAGCGDGSSCGSSASSSKFSAPRAASPPSSTLLGCLKKLEVDLAESRSELAQLKQRQSQMEMAVSSIGMQFANSLGVFSDSVELKKGKELAVVDVGRTAMVGAEEEYGDGRVRSDLWVDETRAEEWMASLEYLPSLSEALTIKMVDDDIRKMKSSKKAKKKQHKKQRKNAVSLVGGIFSSKCR
ncbi:unnamed protein product [Triticum turgidum subsp. durum]|uniref:Uncharacterized protein n=1 Tax=Triticum turgidum subsp. durum TaxID=4567 RepID=A0A9R0ZHW9_TRITD|nr:unnamed protein product [Triticum turgidum subsp. durum]